MTTHGNTTSREALHADLDLLLYRYVDGARTPAESLANIEFAISRLQAAAKSVFGNAGGLSCLVDRFAE